MQIPKQVILCEVGPRDGLQNEKKILTAEEKINLINLCTDAGYPVIEVGSFVHPKAVPQMATTDEVFAGIRKKKGTEYRALVANKKGVERAAKCGCEKVKLNVSASRAHNLANLNCTPQESVARFAECVSFAEENNIAVSGSVSMAFGSPWEEEIPSDDVRKIIESYLDVGIKEISLSDASGMGTPGQVNALFSLVTKEYPEAVFWGHFHNTRGLAIANILAAMDAGITRFDVAFAGCGGCPFVPNATGNISGEDVLNLMEELHIETGVNMDTVLSLGRLAENLLDHRADSYILKAGRNRDLREALRRKTIS